MREDQQARGQEEACHKMKSRGRQGQNTLDLVGQDKGLDFMLNVMGTH